MPWRPSRCRRRTCGCDRRMVACSKTAALLASSVAVRDGSRRAVRARPSQTVRSAPRDARAATRRCDCRGRTYLDRGLGAARCHRPPIWRWSRRAIFIALPLILRACRSGRILAGHAQPARRSAGWPSRRSRITDSNLDTRLEIGNAAEELAHAGRIVQRTALAARSIVRHACAASWPTLRTSCARRSRSSAARPTWRSPHERSAAEYRESLGIILDESRRLSRLVDDLLNLARADAGHVKLQTHDFYLNDLLAECCRSVQALAAARGIDAGVPPRQTTCRSAATKSCCAAW